VTLLHPFAGCIPAGYRFYHHVTNKEDEYRRYKLEYTGQFFVCFCILMYTTYYALTKKKKSKKRVCHDVRMTKVAVKSWCEYFPIFFFFSHPRHRSACREGPQPKPEHQVPGILILEEVFIVIWYPSLVALQRRVQCRLSSCPSDSGRVLLSLFS
jgi:hypothetical protein